ncbi:MAG: dolichyl-diphosphooligosaccharide---protein glycosyltransferase [Thermoproteota archaeon]|nr:dolichyl-diphosphooligosaccharide---protein glycosyltransferase [Thermoproteota archaeon]
MILVVILAVGVRIQPANWGFNLSEFDSYYHYYVTQHIADNGFFSWLNWHISDMWYPFGRDVAASSFAGFPMAGAALYFIISSLGFNISVMDATIIFPVVMATLTCIVAYFLGREVGGSTVGLLAALFLALSPAYIGRTTLGFYKDETVGVFSLVLTSLFYLRSLKQDKWQTSLAYAIGGGASMGYVFASSGESIYILSLMVLFTFIIFITKTFGRHILLSYGALISVGLSFAVFVPKLGFGYLRTFQSIAAIGVLLLLVIFEISNHLSEQRRKNFLVLIIAGLSVAVVVLGLIGFISFPIGRILGVIWPFERISNVIVQSVQEHQPASWSTFFYQFGFLVFLVPLGIMFALQKPTREKIFILTYAMTMLYFASSYVRLSVPLAPALCVLGAFALVEILKSFIDIATQRSFTRRRIRLSPKVGKGFSLVLISCLFVLTLIPLVLQGIDSGYSPTTISASSLPFRASVPDWIEALSWIKENTPQNSVILSWWDYGYWITVAGQRISLVDNATINTTQIARVGQFFMSNETQALDLLMGKLNGVNYNASYVVVFTTLGLGSSGPNLYGDEVKWRWMAQIAGLNDTALEDTSLTSQIATYWEQSISSSTSNYQSLVQWYQQFAKYPLPKSDTVLTKMMVYGTFGIDAPTNFQLVFSSSGMGGQAAPMVFVYKVLYPTEGG